MPDTGISVDVLKEVMAALSAALEHAPRNSLLLAMLAECHLAAYVFGFDEQGDGLAQGRDLVALATTIDPNDPFARFVSGFYFAAIGSRDTACAELESALTINPSDIFVTGLCGNALALLGDFQRGLAILESGRERNPYFTKYHFLPFFLDCLQQGRYQKAVDTARLFYMPAFFWSPLLLCVALHCIHEREEAARKYAHLVRLKPDFPEKGDFYVHFFVVPEDLRDIFKTALEAARLANPDQALPAT